MLPSGTPDGPSVKRKESKKSKSRDKLSQHTHSPGFDTYSSMQLCPGGTSYSLPSIQQTAGINSSVTQLCAGLPLLAESPDPSMAGGLASCSYNTSEVDGWGGGVGRLTLTENLEYSGAAPHSASSQYGEASLSQIQGTVASYHNLDHHDPMYPAHNDLMPEPNSKRVGSTQSRPIKWHQLPPQTDPKLEDKRLRAIKSRRDREKKKQIKKDLEVQLEALGQEVLHLRLEKKSKEKNITFYEREIQKTHHSGELCIRR